MIKLYFIRCEYRVEEDVPIIYLWGRHLETMEKHLFKIHGFEPYFYVLQNEEVPKIPQIKRVIPGFKSIFEEPCKKIIVDVPENVKDLRKLFTKTYEADVPFTRRFLVNLGIRRYFSVPENKTELNYAEIIGE